ncbi:LOW QUALITY PROTEIN: hypothetical protein V2J09_008405 [Rumex salicifolius]
MYLVFCFDNTLQEYSLNPPPTIRSLPSQIQSALVIVNKCNEAMELMQKEFSKLSEEATLLGKGQKEMFDIKCRIVFLLEGLFKETSLEGGQNPQTATCLPASAVLGNISSCFPTESHASKVMYEVFKMLDKMELGITAMAISLSKGESVEKQQLKVLRRKSAVAHKLESLFMENTEELRWSSMKETNEKERYLCLSNGYEIWCLDLNRLLSNPHYKLPKVATLSLLGSQLPASVGLFKFGSDAFMIGGQQLPSSINNPSVISDRLQIHGWDNEGLALYKTLIASGSSSLHLPGPSPSSVAGACVLLLLPAVLVRPPPPSCSAGREPGSAPVATGSHIDAIPYSGKYDGVAFWVLYKPSMCLKGTFIMGRERKMKRKRSDEYSLNPPPTIYSLPSQIESALVIVNKCYEAMELMQKEFSKLSEEATLLGKGQKEIFDIKCRIVFLLEGLFKETSLEGCQNPQTATCLPASAVLGNLSSCFPTESHASKVMYEVFKMLYKMELGISAMAISLSKGESVEKQQPKVLHRKSAVVHKLESLFMESEENTVVEFMDLESSDSEDCDDEEDHSFPAPIKQPGLNMEELRWSSMKETNEKERYLCLSNGYEIWCLDFVHNHKDDMAVVHLIAKMQIGLVEENHQREKILELLSFSHT